MRDSSWWEKVMPCLIFCFVYLVLMISDWKKMLHLLMGSRLWKLLVFKRVSLGSTWNRAPPFDFLWDLMSHWNFKIPPPISLVFIFRRWKGDSCSKFIVCSFFFVAGKTCYRPNPLRVLRLKATQFECQIYSLWSISMNYFWILSS